jgi:hypothetical protein
VPPGVELTEDGAWQHRTSGPVHTYFGLSYASHEVLPRVLLQSMPIEWQRRWVACMEEYRAAFREVEGLAPGYKVDAVDWVYVSEATDEQRAAAGVTSNWDEVLAWDDAEGPKGPEPELTYWDERGTEIDSVQRIPVPAIENLPEYRHGYVQPNEMAIAAETDTECGYCGARWAAGVTEKWCRCAPDRVRPRTAGGGDG